MIKLDTHFLFVSMNKKQKGQFIKWFIDSASTMRYPIKPPIKKTTGIDEDYDRCVNFYAKKNIILFAYESQNGVIFHLMTTRKSGELRNARESISQLTMKMKVIKEMYVKQVSSDWYLHTFPDMYRNTPQERFLWQLI